MMANPETLWRHKKPKPQTDIRSFLRTNIHSFSYNTIQYNTLKTYIARLYKNVQGR